MSTEDCEPTLEELITDYQHQCLSYALQPSNPTPSSEHEDNKNEKDEKDEKDEEDEEDEEYDLELKRQLHYHPDEIRNSLKTQFPFLFDPDLRRKVKKEILNKPPYAYSMIYHGDLTLKPPLSLNPYNGDLTRVSFHRYANIIESPQFQRICRIIQLSQVNLVYPCDHKRGEHCLMASYFAGKSADHFALTDYERRLVEVYALVHDIGHAPWGHCAENLLRGQGFDHEREGIRICTELKKHIEEHVKLDDIISMFTGAHPLSPIVSGTYGADRIAYLLRDLEMVGCLQEEPYLFFRLNADTLIQATRLVDTPQGKTLAVDSAWIDIAANFLTARAIAYSKIYHNPNVQILQRCAHKILEASGFAKPEILMNLNDKQLQTQLHSHPETHVSHHYFQQLHLANIPLTALAMKIEAQSQGFCSGGSEPLGFEELTGYHSFSTPHTFNYFYGISKEQAAELHKKFKDHKTVQELENRIAHLLNNERPFPGYLVSSDDIAVIVPANVHKTQTENAPILCGNEVKNLFDLRPDLAWSFERLTRHHWSFRIAVPRDIREDVAYFFKFKTDFDWIMGRE